MSGRVALVVLAVCLVLTGCARGPAPQPSSNERDSRLASAPLEGVSGEVAALRDAFASQGFEVQASGPATGGLLPAQFFRFAVNGSTLQVYRFSTPQLASAAASGVSVDGTSLGTTSASSQIDWKGRPHFFRRDRLIVILLSDDELTPTVDSNDAAIHRVLEQQMGSQFAGQ
jgi:hypothetical protein